MLKLLLSLLRMFEAPIRANEIDEWAQLEFGRNALPSDLDGRVS